MFGFGDGEWDTIQLKYLFASLPFELVDRFIENVMLVAGRLGLTPEYQGSTTNASVLRSQFGQFRDELLTETGDDAGSESLAIFIHSTYPRR